MPLLKVADRYFDDRPSCLYDFPKEHKETWCEFWKSLDGDHDKIIDFAKKAGVENPVEWAEELHRFLFDVFIGCPELAKKASKENFGKFLDTVAKEHEKNPKDKRWYLERGILPDDFAPCLKAAAELEKPSEAINHLNNHIVNFGNDLYSEFLLLKTKQSAELKSLASKLTKDAYDMERKVLGDKHPVSASIKVGATFKHKNFDDTAFECTGTQQQVTFYKINGTKKSIGTDYLLVFCKDASGNIHIFDDMWNLIPVNSSLDKDIKNKIEQHKGDNPDFKHIKESLIHALQQDPIDTKLVKELAEDLKLPLSDLGL